jgi:hypothetical protein
VGESPRDVSLVGFACTQCGFLRFHPLPHFLKVDQDQT